MQAGLFSVILVGALLQVALGIPVRGNYPWSVILCRFYDIPTEPRTPEYFRNWFLDKSNAGSVASYFSRASNGLYNMDGSAVHGWFSMPYRRQAMDYLAEKDANLAALYPSPGAVPLKVYHKIKESCVETAKARGILLHHRVITVINSDNIAMFCSQQGILLTPETFATAALAHEMVHSFHIGHSYSNRAIQIFPYANYGEYDDLYDLMSTSNAYMYSTQYGMSGPGLNGPHLDYLGWLPISRMLYFGKDGIMKKTLTLGSLSEPHAATNGYLQVLIPYDRENHLNYLTVSFRTRSNLDTGLPNSAVLIHRIKEKRGHLFSYLITNDRSWRHQWLEGEEYTVYLSKAKDMSININVISFDPDQNTAEVTIQSTFDPTKCLATEQKRKATRIDKMCVHYREHGLIQAENRLAWRAMSLTGKCRDSYVKRNATPGDNVCVTKSRHNEVKAQNLQWQRYSLFYNVLTWGLNSCLEGFVWRQIDDYDYACVTPERRNFYANQISESTCSEGKVHRAAFLNDNVCVNENDKYEARIDSDDAQNYLVYRQFFNGIDNVD